MIGNLRAATVAAALLVGAAAPAGAQALPLPAEDGYLERFNRAMFRVNAFLGNGVSSAAAAVGFDREPSPAVEGAARVLFNFVNEPVSIVSHVVSGEFGQAWVHAKRFALNTALGYGGAVDVAAARGLPPDAADFGLSLCRYGVPAGPYVYVPVLGPRTLRDAVSDVVLGNLVIVGMLAPVLPWQTIALVAVLDEVVVLAVARQLDPLAASIEAKSYDEAKAIYLRERERRCAVMRSPVVTTQ